MVESVQFLFLLQINFNNFDDRGELEEKSEFLGLIVMQNFVKEETYPAIKVRLDF